MSYRPAPRRSVVANAIYGVLNPIPFGFFVAALIFDVIYAKTGEMLWMKGAAWLIAIGLVFAIIVAVVNAFVHSRDAYSVIPAGAWLSALTVLLLAIAHIVIAVQPTASGNLIHE